MWVAPVCFRLVSALMWNVARIVQETETAWGKKAAGEVMCPLFLHNCVSQPFAHLEVVNALSDETRGFYLTAHNRLIGEQAVRVDAAERAVKEAAEEERRVQMSAPEREADACKRHISEQILTLRCPHCAQGFNDFEGCFALTCSRATCRWMFCGWCLAGDYPGAGKNDGHRSPAPTPVWSACHQHVADCPQALRDRPDNPVFGTIDQFHQFHHTRKTAELRQYLAGLGTDEMRARVLEVCHAGIPDFGKDFGAAVVGDGNDGRLPPPAAPPLALWRAARAGDAAEAGQLLAAGADKDEVRFATLPLPRS